MKTPNASFGGPKPLEVIDLTRDALPRGEHELELDFIDEPDPESVPSERIPDAESRSRKRFLGQLLSRLLLVPVRALRTAPDEIR